jgi:DNA-3-methyladenine glycosylase I
MAAKGGLRAANGVARCWWCGAEPEYVRYHDEEWGRPVADDRRLFEKLCLEGFQAGLSWWTILRRREAFRRAFDGFEPERVARFDRRRVERLVGDAGIIRHRGKIEAAVGNAQAALEVIGERGSLAALVWGFEPPASERPRRVTRAALSRMATTPSSTALSKELRRRGFRFVGPTTAYAFMQAMGLVNDHLEGCHRRAPVERERAAFPRPR